jgi:hypothetical protein
VLSMATSSVPVATSSVPAATSSVPALDAGSGSVASSPSVLICSGFTPPHW